MKTCKRIMSAILAGIAVSIGGIAYLQTGYAWLFPIGLYIVCFYNLDLFTGRICYYRRTNSFGKYPLIWFFNTASAYLTGMVMAQAKPAIVEKARSLAQAKLANFWALIPLAILCNLCIFVAVDTWKRTWGNPVGLLFATTIFVACGFEHCIANSFYFGLAGEKSLRMAFFLIANTVWNGIGGILACRLLTLMKGEK